MNYLTPSEWFNELGQTVLRPLQKAMDGLCAEMRHSAPQISERNDEYIVTIEMPPLEKHQVNVSVNGRQLTITGDLWQHTTQQVDGETREHASFHKIHRSFTLPPMIDADRVTANMEGNKLRITIPKCK